MLANKEGTVNEIAQEVANSRFSQILLIHKRKGDYGFEVSL